MKSENKRTVPVFLSVQGLSLIGSRLTAIAVGIWFVKETGTVTPLLLISLFNELPLFFFGTAIGMVVDRLKRKTAIMIGDTGQALCTLLLVLSITNGASIGWVYLIVAIQGLFMSLQSVASTTLIPLMVKNDELDRVNSMKELLFPLAGIIAPFLAGMLYEPIGLVGIVVIDLLTFLVSITIVAFLPLSEVKDLEPVGKKGNLWHEALEGYRFLWVNKPLLYLFLYFAWWNFILNGPLELAIPYFLYRTGSDTSMSWLLLAMNAGALTGALFAVWWGHFKHKILFILAGAMLTSIMFIIMGVCETTWIMAGSIFLLMLPLAMTGSLFTSLLQRKTPLKMQGRVFVVFGQLSAVSAPLSFLITGPIVDQWLEPAMKAGKWPWINSLTGHDSGSGIGFLFVVCGLLLSAGVFLILSKKSVRKIENVLPDYLD
jgi:MFS transporter, DHA3 family, macrolide efflux protein